MHDAARRAIRTFLQGVVGVLAIVVIPIRQNMVEAVIGGEAIALKLDVWQSIVIAALAGGFLAVISFAQNELEDAARSDYC